MSMYNKIFTKILDSSVWLESNSTRIVWMTLIAAMDEHGFCQFAAMGNLAGRARVSIEDARQAVETLSSPDPESSDPDNEGRRIERVPGGWVVLNAEKYRSIVTRAVSQEKTRERVARFRAKKRGETDGNAQVTKCNVRVTPSEADTDTEADTEHTQKRTLASTALAVPAERGKLLGTILLNKGAYEVRQDDFERDRPLYPGIDVMAEYRAMKAWSIANPSLRKTSRGIHRFMNQWLSRKQDGIKGGNTNGTYSDKAIERQRESQRNIAAAVRRATGEADGGCPTLLPEPDFAGGDAGPVLEGVVGDRREVHDGAVREGAVERFEKVGFLSVAVRH